jgi:hypothetical protein
MERAASEALSVRRVEENEFLRRASLEGFNTAAKTGCMYLQFVTVRVQKIQRVAFAVILLPSRCAGIDQTRTKRLEIGLRCRECNVVISRIHGAVGEIGFEGKAQPKDRPPPGMHLCTSVPLASGQELRYRSQKHGPDRLLTR